LVLGVMPNAQAECTLATLNGSYAFTGSGTALDVGGPVNNVGIATFDGKGNISVAFTQNLNGNVAHLSATSTYTVNPDCTGSIELGADFVIIDGGNEVFSIRTISQRVVSSVYKRLFPRRHHDDEQD